MHRCSESSPTALILAATVLMAGCGSGGGGDGGTPPSTTAIAKTSANNGDAQSATVGQPLANPIQVVVTENGSASPGVTVAWATGAGSVTASGPTGADGVASSQWTLGNTSGSQTATATLAGATGSPVTFSATATADAAATLAKTAANNGDNQTGEINSQLPLPLQARVTDQFGNAVAGAAVNWSATGAAVSAATVASDASGLAPVIVTLGGAAGSITIIAEAADLTGSPLTFSATAVIPTPAPTSIGITVGNDFFRSDRNQTTGPAVDTVAVGGTVTWTWAPAASLHNVTSNPPPGFTGSPTQAAGTTYSFVFPAAGTYRYYCSIHATAAFTAGMIGRIVVK